MTEKQPTEVLQVNDTFALGKCDYFIDVRLWPLAHRLNPRRWLSNFRQAEMNHAVSLLNAFLYFDKALVDQLLLGAFQNLSRLFSEVRGPFLSSQLKWREFFDTAIITCVKGEQPNPTDSGYTFLRMARQVLGIREDQIVEPQEALEKILKNPRPIVFLDDFVGSGQQFISTWRRQVPLPSQGVTSFELLSSMLRNSQFFYCPLVCTSYGKNQILSACPAVNLQPAHLLPDDYSAFSPKSIIWPNELRESATDFIKSVSARAGISSWKGFHNLGLAIAFEHSVPDASLPILYWNLNGWKPLIERT